MPSKPSPTRNAKGKKSVSVGKKNASSSEQRQEAIGHPPALGAWRPLPLQRQLDAFAVAVAAGKPVLSSGKPAPPHRDFLPPRHAAAAARGKQQEDLVAAANEETAATTADASATAADAGGSAPEGDAAATATAAAAAAAAIAAHGSSSSAAAAAATAARNAAAAFRAGALYCTAKFNAMAHALSGLKEAFEARPNKRSSSSSCAAGGAAAQKQQHMFTELQRLLLLLGQPNSAANRLRQLDDTHRWYTKFCALQQQQQQQQQRQQQQQQQGEVGKRWGGSLHETAEMPLPGSAFWVPEGDATTLSLHESNSVQQQQQQQQQQQEALSFVGYVQSHAPVCTAADKLRLYSVRLLCQPKDYAANTQKQQQQQQRQSSQNPFLYRLPQGQPPWGLVLPQQQNHVEQASTPDAAPVARPRQWKFDGSCFSPGVTPKLGFTFYFRTLVVELHCLKGLGFRVWWSSWLDGRVVQGAAFRPQSERAWVRIPLQSLPVPLALHERVSGRNLRRYSGSDRRSLPEARVHMRWLAARREAQAKEEREAERRTLVEAWRAHRDVHAQGAFRAAREFCSTFRSTKWDRGSPASRRQHVQQRFTCLGPSAALSSCLLKTLTIGKEKETDSSTARGFSTATLQQQQQQQQQQQAMLFQQRHTAADIRMLASKAQDGLWSLRESTWVNEGHPAPAPSTAATAAAASAAPLPAEAGAAGAAGAAALSSQRRLLKVQAGDSLCSSSSSSGSRGSF
ncbi:hypothetical protein Esti_002138 [Eimeria stiedai]